jgi:DNA-directed RNA polymerase specialized sigma24 family protein
MATERVNLTLEADALAAARRAASGEGVSLSAWLSRAAWNQAIEHAARISAEQNRQLAELADYDAERDELMWRDAA